MESTRTSMWTNGSRFSPNVSNDSFGFTKDTSAVNTDYISITSLTLCSLGLPCNLLVIAVYVRHMTSSMRVYMFALAIADSAICVCVLIHVQTPTIILIKFATLIVLDVAVSFSMFLLVFVAIERLKAILRPHLFDKNPQRACTALLIIASAAVAFVALLTMTKVLRLKKSIRHGIQMGTIVVSVLTMTLCYTFIATALLERARSSRNRVAVNLTGLYKSRPSHMFLGGTTHHTTSTTTTNGGTTHPTTSTTTDNGGTTHPTTSTTTNNGGTTHPTTSTTTDNGGTTHPTTSTTTDNVVTTRPAQSALPHDCPVVSNGSTDDKDRPQSRRCSASGVPTLASVIRNDGRSTCVITSVVPTNKPTAMQSTAHKNVLLLFVITVVFAACWLPFWLYGLGVHVSRDLFRLFVVNSVVNPFI